MYLMRLRLPTLMAEKGMKNAYALMKASHGEMTITTATRLVRADGKPKRVDLATLDQLCRIFDLRDMNDLWERDDLAPRPPAAPAVRKRGGKGKRAAA